MQPLTAPRLKIPPWTVALAAGTAVFLLLYRLAHASPPDLNATATSAESLVALVTTYGWVGALGVAYIVVRMLLKANDVKHVVAQGKVLAYVTAAVGVAGTAMQALLSGSPWTGVLLTAVLAVVHLVDAGAPAQGGAS